MTHKYSNLYCPNCLKLLSRGGECWIPCEYEADIGCGEHAPLTEIQRIEKLIVITKDRLKRARKTARELQADIKNHESQLETLSLLV